MYLPAVFMFPNPVTSLGRDEIYIRVRHRGAAQPGMLMLLFGDLICSCIGVLPRAPVFAGLCVMI